jgi:tRNA A37 threonylcarbamoyladenosine dehydratase
MTDNWKERTELLLGKERLEKLEKSNVLVMGLGGVGAYAAEMLCRAGIGNLTIVDGDVVQASNRNRQLIALVSNHGKSKAELMKSRLLDINPRANITAVDQYLKDQAMFDVIDSDKFDFVVDAIDTLAPKVSLLHYCVSKSIPVVSSMGAGGKTDPSLIRIADISKSHNDNLARILRKRLHRLGIFIGITVVFSSEKVDKEAVKLIENEENKKSTVGTISYFPPIFGCMVASVVIQEIIKVKEDSIN